MHPGPLSACYLSQMIGYLKDDETLASQELQDVEITMQRLLQTETKPTYEIFSVGLNLQSFELPYLLTLAKAMLCSLHLDPSIILEKDDVRMMHRREFQHYQKDLADL